MKRKNKHFDIGNKQSGIAKWAYQNKDKYYRLWVYKRNYTPYEEQQAFTDESLFESNTAEIGRIKEVVELPDGDVLIGFETQEFIKLVDYYKLSEIRLEFCEEDQNKNEETEGENDGEESW